MDDALPNRVRQLLGRGGDAPPLPPPVHEPTARRVYSELGLPELFVHAARRGGAAADLVYVEQLAAEVADHLRQLGVSRVTLTPSPMLRKVRLGESLASLWLEVTDGPAEAVVTGCDVAVAETGDVVFRGGTPPGWAAARVRVVVLEPKNFVPDLIDLFATETGDVTLVSGATVRTFVLH